MLKKILNKEISVITCLLIAVLVIGSGFLGYGISTAMKNHRHYENLESLYDVTNLNNEDNNLLNEDGTSIDYEEYLEFKEKAQKNFSLEEVSFDAELAYNEFGETELVGFEIK